MVEVGISCVPVSGPYRVLWVVTLHMPFWFTQADIIAVALCVIVRVVSGLSYFCYRQGLLACVCSWFSVFMLIFFIVVTALGCGFLSR